MNIEEAISARLRGASLPVVLAGLTENRKVRIPLRARVRRALQEAENENGGKGSLTQKVLDVVKDIEDTNGPNVAGAVMADVRKELSPEAQQAFDAVSGGGGGGGMDLGDVDLGSLDFGGGGEAPEPKEKEGDAPESGATEAPDELEDLAGETTKAESVIRRLRRRLRAAQALGEALLRRALRVQAERNHLQRRLGLNENATNLDTYCESGHVFDVRTRACVRCDPKIERIVKEMMDPISGSKADQSELGTTYRAGLDNAENGEDDPISGSKARVSGKDANRFTRGTNKDPLITKTADSGGAMGTQMGEQFTFAGFNPGSVRFDRGDGDQSKCPVGYIWDEENAACVPTTRFPNAVQGGGVGESSVPFNAHEHESIHLNEARDPMGRLLEGQPSGQAHRRDDQVRAYRRRYNVAERERLGRIAMIQEVFTNAGIPQNIAYELAECAVMAPGNMDAVASRAMGMVAPDAQGPMMTQLGRVMAGAPPSGMVPDGVGSFGAPAFPGTVPMPNADMGVGDIPDEFEEYED